MTVIHLTPDQTADFASIIQCDPRGIEDGTIPVTLTSASLASFIIKQGLPISPISGYWIWPKVQTRPGARPGQLVVADYDDFRAVFFDGES